METNTGWVRKVSAPPREDISPTCGADIVSGSSPRLFTSGLMRNPGSSCVSEALSLRGVCTFSLSHWHPFWVVLWTESGKLGSFVVWAPHTALKSFILFHNLTISAYLMLMFGGRGIGATLLALEAG